MSGVQHSGDRILFLLFHVKTQRISREMDIDRDTLQQLYYYLKLTRHLEERVTSRYRQGKVVGGVWTSNGTEAVSVGFAYALEKDDITFIGGK